MSCKICSRCKRELPIDMFYNSKNTKDGHYSYCKECCSELHREYQIKNKEKMREISKRSWAKNRDKRNATDRGRMSAHFNFINSLKTPCVKCGEDRFYVIDFHHIDPSKKLFTLSDGQKAHKSKVDVLREVDKCVCLCKNCHKEFHYFYGVSLAHPIEDLRKYLEEGVTNE